MNSLNIIAYADKKYSIFAIPYTFFALTTNKSAVVEIFFENLEHFLHRNKTGITKLKEIFGSRFLFRQSKYSNQNVIPNTIRFLEKPLFKSKYIYIGDIDLLILDNIVNTHTNLINKNSIPFSNILRTSSLDTKYPRLSGLHFCKYEDYYPIPDLSDLDLTKVNDEYVLYEIMLRKSLMVPVEFQTRPECGIHISLNRDSLGRASGINSNEFNARKSLAWSGSKYFEKYKEIISNNDHYSNLFKNFDYEYRLISMALESTIDNTKSATLHRISCAYMIDRRILSSKDINQKELLSLRDSHINSGDLQSAMDVSSRLVALWPENKNLWFKYAWNAKAIGDSDRVSIGLSHLLELDDSNKYIKALEN